MKNYKGLLWLFVIHVVLLGFACCVKASPRDAVFNLAVNNRSICTAFAVQGNRGERVLLTAGHCSQGLNAFSDVVAIDTIIGTRYPVRLMSTYISWAKVSDYSIFRYVDKVPATALIVTREIPSVGDTIFVIEGPLGLIPFSVRGYYSGLARFSDQINTMEELLWIQIPCASGASGSPVLNEKGLVWGILVGRMNELAGMSLVVPIPAGQFGL